MRMSERNDSNSLFICCLLNKANYSSDYVASNESTINE